MIQSIVNKIYRYPKANWKKIKRFGGYVKYLEMMQNEKAMKKASLKLPPVKSYSDGLCLCYLTGAKYLHQTLFCIKSLINQSDEKFRFILVDDGSLTDQLITQIERQLPGAEIVTKAMLDQNLEKRLPENLYPILRNKRREYSHIKKLTDIHTIPGNGWKLVLDSDMLFIKEPLAIIEWLKHPKSPLHMVDCQESYGYTNQLMEKLSGFTIPVKMNVGAFGFNSDAIDWNIIEHWVMVLENQEGCSYYLEQGLSAMLVAGQDCTILNKDEYIVNPNDNAILDKTGILHHYVDLAKKGYFNIAWKNIV